MPKSDPKQQKETTSGNPLQGSQSLFRGLQLIDILSDFPNGCPLAHLAEIAGLNKSTTHRLLQGLSQAGYVKPAPSFGSYRLSTKLLELGHKTLSSLNIVHVAAPHLQTLNLETGETVNFSTKEQDKVVLIYKLEPTRGMLRTRAYIGQQMPLYCSAMGKLYLAYDTPVYLDEYWQRYVNSMEKFTAHTIVEYSAMQRELLQIKTQCLAMDNEENEVGVSCIAAPIFDINHAVMYAVSISLPTIKLTAKKRQELIDCIKKTARAISTEIGGQFDL